MTTVLGVIATSTRRGAEVFAVELAGALPERLGATTVALAAADGKGMDVPILGRRRLSVATLRALRRRSHDASVVVAHGSTTLPACAIGLAGARAPFVYRSIGDPSHWSGSPARRLRVRAYLSRATRVVAVYRGGADALVRSYGVAPETIDVIPTGVPAARFPAVTAEGRARGRALLGVDADVPLVVVIGALSKEKRVHDIVDAVATLDGVQLAVVGDGPERASVQTHAAHVLGPRVVVAGPTTDPSGVLQAADAVAMASATEGVPAALIEAGLTGVPVVATDVGGVRDVIIDGITGYVVPVGDISALAARLDDALRAGGRLGDPARAHCLERFELGPVAAAYANMLDSMIQLRENADRRA